MSKVVLAVPDAARSEVDFAPVSAQRALARRGGDESFFYCHVYADPPVSVQQSTPYGGYNSLVRGSGHNFCEPPTSYQELWVDLQRYGGGQWNWLAGDYSEYAGPGTIFGNPSFDCNHDDVRTYRDVSSGYAIVNGTGYFGTSYDYANHTCHDGY